MNKIGQRSFEIKKIKEEEEYTEGEGFVSGEDENRVELATRRENKNRGDI